MVQENRHIQEHFLKSSKSKSEQQSRAEDDQKSNRLFEQLQSQIKILSQEKGSFQELWHKSQRTVASLESEVALYRQQLTQPGSIHALKNEYLRRLKEMGMNIRDVKGQLDKENTTNNELRREKVEAESKVNDLESKFKGIGLTLNHVCKLFFQ